MEASQHIARLIYEAIRHGGTDAINARATDGAAYVDIQTIYGRWRIHLEDRNRDDDCS